MTDFNFDGRVAVITGAGRGMGRGYALLLAARGASVVVNDLGGSIAGVGADMSTAETVVSEIRIAGGIAIADGTDVSQDNGGQSLIDATIETFGRVDIVINNAGIMRWAGFPKADVANLRAHLDVHVTGSFNVARAAWPHMVDQRYGRIVDTTSAGMFGLPNNLSYATAKGGVVGMTRSLATAGAPHNILVNLIAPAAVTRMGGAAPNSEPPTSGPMSPDRVAPMVAFLSHETCSVTGEIYAAGFGRFQRIFLATTPGYVHERDDGEPPTIEDIAANWSVINNETGYSVPADLIAWSEAFMQHLPPTER